MLRSTIAVCYCVHDDYYYLAESIRSFQPAGNVIVFVSRTPWNDLPGDWETSAQAAGQAGAEVVVGEWTSERDHREACFEWLLKRGYTHALTPDGDEFVEPALLETLLTIIHNELADRVYVWMDTYWQSPEYIIRPREQLTPVILVDLRCVQVIRDRYVVGGRELVLSPAHGVLHHLSYAGPDARIRRKLDTFSHRDEIRPGWWDNVWLRWKSNKLLRNLHPTHPTAYEFTERIDVPELLLPALARCEEYTKRGGGRMESHR